MSETEVAIRDQQLDGYTTEINDLFGGLPGSKSREKDLDALDTKLKDFETALDTMHLDMKGLDLALKKNFRKKYTDHKKNLKEWNTKLEFAKKDATRSDLMAGATPDNAGHDMNSAAGMMAYGAAVQADTTASLQRTLGVVADARDLGTATAAKLDSQNKQMAGMLDDIASIDNTLARANKTIRRIARKMATDKCLWVMILLVIGAIIWIIVKKNH